MSDSEKALLRDELLARRRSRTPLELADAGAALAAHAAGEPLLARAHTIAAYLSMPTEPPTGPLIDSLLNLGRTVLIPVVAPAHRLEWVAIDNSTMTAASGLGIPEPVAAPEDSRSSLAACDVVLVPALAADHSGHRLGRGAGYYDRALADVTVPIVAVVFTEELHPEVPVEAHDVSVDAVLTPSGLFRVQQS